jgi:DNA-directed RNA polymerase subunit alpha
MQDLCNSSWLGEEDFFDWWIDQYYVLNFVNLRKQLLEKSKDEGIFLDYSKHDGQMIGLPFGTIFIDSIFTPIVNVQYTIENFRVEQKTDYEKLVFNIKTDGSIHPKEALKEAAKILIHHFMLFSDERITLDSEIKAETEEFDETSLHMRQLLKTKLVDMDLSVRALNCLKAADVETLGDLVSYAKSDLLKFRNFGKKSLTELEDLVDNKGLTFGMNVAKYKLDKD